MEEEKMKEPDNIDYLKMALALSGISVNRVTAELIIETWDKICQKGGKFNIGDAVKVEWDIIKKHRTITAIDKSEK